MSAAPKRGTISPQRPAFQAGGVEFRAGAEARTSTPLSPTILFRGWSPFPPFPVRPSAPARNSTPSGEFGAEYYSIVECRDPKDEPRAVRWPASRSSLVLQQINSTEPRAGPIFSRKPTRSGPPGVLRLPAGLRRVVNRQAPVLRFAPALRVTARRPAGGPAVPGGWHRSDP